jgi:hypothetical protein
MGRMNYCVHRVLQVYLNLVFFFCFPGYSTDTDQRHICGVSVLDGVSYMDALVELHIGVS